MTVESNTTTARPIPAPRAICEHCRGPIIWAKTVAGPNGPGGKSQPFDPVENPAGRVALFVHRPSRVTARALMKDEDLANPGEYLGMPHAATCPGRHVPTGEPGVTTFDLVHQAIAVLRSGHVAIDPAYDHLAADLLEVLAEMHESTGILESLWQVRAFALAIVDGRDN